MQQPTSNQSSFSFLQGGGEMGKLMRSKNWSTSLVGDPETWPQSLRTTLSIILNSKFPMFLFWGPELICFYNDAYRPSLGKKGKHPGILGSRGEDYWEEIWPVIKPLIDQVLAGGEATWSEDQLIPIYRNGKIEDVYWTFSYSPVNDESGKPAGVFVTCNETTDKVFARKTLEETERKLRLSIRQASVAIAIFRGSDYIVEIVNSRALELWGRKEEEVINKPILQAMPELVSQGIKDLLDNVYQTGNPFTATELPVEIYRNKKLETVYLDFVYEPVYDADGKINGIMTVGTDVTKHLIERKKVEESELDLRNMVLNAPIGICVIDARSLISEIVNDSFIEVAGKSYDEIAGKHYWDTFAEAKPYYEAALNKVVEDGVPFYANEVELMLIRHGKEETIYVTFVYSPLKNAEGKVKKVAVWVLENTAQVRARQKIEEADKRFRDTVRQAPVGITILRGSEFIVEMANDAYLELVDRKKMEFVGRPLFDSLPEVEASVHGLLDDVLNTGIPFHGIEYPIPVNRYGKQEISYFNFLYHPLKEDDSKISGIIVIVTDVSESVKAKQNLAESEKQLRKLVMQSPVPMTIFRGRDFVIEMANTVMFENIWRKKEKDVIGKKLLDVFPELSGQKYPQLLNEVYATGKVHSEIESIAYIEGDDGLKKFYLDFEYNPLFDTNGNVSGIMTTVNDVTEKVEARKTVEESEQRLRSFVESAPFPIGVYTGKEMQIQFANQAILDVWGKGKNVIGRRYAEVLPELEGQGIFEQLDSVYTTGIPFHAHNERVDLMIHEKLTPHYFNYSFTPLFDITGKIYGVMNTAAEVTDLVTTKQKIEESEKKFRLLADSMPQHIWTGDVSGHLNYFNQSVFTYSGLSPEQIDKDGWLQIVHPDDHEENIQTWTHSIITGEPFLFEHRFRRHDGEYRWQLSRALPVKDSNGKIQMWVGTSTDIDEIKKHQQEKDDFIKIASHELKTPVTTIKAYVQLLLNQGSTRQDVMLTKSLSTIEKQITKLAKLIADLMDVTKIELGSFQANKENFSMTELTRDIISNLQATTTHHIHFNYAADILVNADKDRITQVLTNLLTNAIKYSPNAHKVIVDITTNAKELIVSIQDFGIGMANKDHEKIFDRFYRVENPEGKIFPGFGIGLFIVREIISNHKGKVWVKSEPNKGSTFYFSLPI